MIDTGNMTVIQVPPSRLIPYDDNPRRTELAVPKVKASIRRFGFRNPILVDPDYTIIEGHTRRLAAIELGMETVPVIVCSDLTDEEVRALRVIDNKVAEYAQWDFSKLDQEVAAISGLADFDLADFGLEKVEFDYEAVRELAEETRTTPASRKWLRCPCCGHAAVADDFQRVEPGSSGDGASQQPAPGSQPTDLPTVEPSNCPTVQPSNHSDADLPFSP